MPAATSACNAAESSLYDPGKLDPSYSCVRHDAILDLLAPAEEDSAVNIAAQFKQLGKIYLNFCGDTLVMLEVIVGQLNSIGRHGNCATDGADSNCMTHITTVFNGETTPKKSGEIAV